MAIRELTPLRVLASPAPKASDDPRVVTEIYRPFFLAGILSVLTAGCLLGAVALLGIAIQGSYTANAWTPYVLAHANSQLYGWVGFFVIGFALQQHAPRASRLPLFNTLSRWTLVLMGIGIGLRFAAEPLVAVDPAVWIPVGVFSCVLQAFAVTMFMATTTLTRFKTGAPLRWQSALVFASLFWWLVVAWIEPYFFVASHGAHGVVFVGQWFSPYREAQFLGFVSMMIFGVALVKMSSCFGASEACPKLGLTGFVLWNVGLVTRMIGWLSYFQSDLQVAWPWHLGGALLAAGAVCLVMSSRMLAPLRESMRAQKFVRAAFIWLLISGVLLVLEPFHLAVIGKPFSHAYTGAIRHAITVGFISQMIIGVSIHVVARMNDLESRTLNPLWIVFVLLNLGNTLRVGLEIGTDYTGSAFMPMGFTGFIELVALLFWAANVAAPMLRRRRLAHA